MGCLPFVARCYRDIVQRLGVRAEASGAGRVTLVATTASAGQESLAALSELALAVAYTNAPRDRQVSLPIKLRIGFFVARTVWSGTIRATAQASRCGRGWLLECELRDEQGRVLSTAFAHAPD